ncbi:MAG: molybdopterin molybdotransferase MoeA [Armatimonadota bacterium]
MGNDGPLNPDTALETILGTTPRLGTEKISLQDALGRVLVEDIHAKDDIPPFDNSAMDGYALIAADTLGAGKDVPVKLKVIAEAPAGTVVDERVESGTAVRIMTGAPVPQGADSVIMVEDTIRQDDDVLIMRESKQGVNIRPAAEDVRCGELVIQAGRRIRPAEMGMLAALGVPEIHVSMKPRIAIITSGNELVDVTETPGAGQIRDSNQYSIIGQVLQAGGEVSMVSRLTDEKDELERVLTSAAATSDMIITSGGVSVGDYDFVKETLAKLGDIRFWKVYIKPGKPLVYGHIKGVPLFGLPGNPVSSMVTFDLFVRPAILQMMGLENTSYKTVSAVVMQDLRHKICVREFVRAATVWNNGRYEASPTGIQGSGRLSSMIGANSYIIIPEATGDLKSGEIMQVVLFE